MKKKRLTQIIVISGIILSCVACVLAFVNSKSYINVVNDSRYIPYENNRNEEE